jgi:hypothetical protein
LISVFNWRGRREQRRHNRADCANRPEDFSRLIAAVTVPLLLALPLELLALPLPLAFALSTTLAPPGAPLRRRRRCRRQGKRAHPQGVNAEHGQHGEDPRYNYAGAALVNHGSSSLNPLKTLFIRDCAPH